MFSDPTVHLLVSLLLAILPVAGIFYGFYSDYARRRDSPFRNLPYPPGPPPKGLLSGIANDLPTSQPWLIYAKLSRVYGNILYFRHFKQHVIVLNSAADAIELFEKRAGLYSDRPRNVLAEIMGWDFNVSLMPYGDLWRQHKRLFQQLFRLKPVQDFTSTQEREIHLLLRDLLENPTDFLKHTRGTSLSILLSTMYGYDLHPETRDQFLDLTRQTNEKLSEALLPGAILINSLPLLRYLPSWFPGSTSRWEAAKMKEITNQILESPIDFVRKGMMDGSALTSVVSELLETCYVQRQYDVVKRVAATSYAAGADTTASLLQSFFLAMVLFPDVQVRAQADIDQVVGRGRLPRYSDRPNLPYLDALYRELLRWAPPLPLNLAHTVTEDDIYRGFYIPKGATILANIWAMSRDEEKYNKPDLFMPERFLKSGSLIDDEMELVFGFGRRKCPGRHMASNTVWFTIVSVLSTFNIERKKDSRGKDIPLEPRYLDGMMSSPCPFECAISPRSNVARRLILNPSSGSKE